MQYNKENASYFLSCFIVDYVNPLHVKFKMYICVLRKSKDFFCNEMDFIHVLNLNSLRKMHYDGCI